MRPGDGDVVAGGAGVRWPAGKEWPPPGPRPVWCGAGTGGNCPARSRGACLFEEMHTHPDADGAVSCWGAGAHAARSPGRFRVPVRGPRYQPEGTGTTRQQQCRGVDVGKKRSFMGAGGGDPELEAQGAGGL